MTPLSLSQAADDAVEEHRRRLDLIPATPEDLARIAEPLTGRNAADRYRRVFRRVIEMCEAEGWNPRTFVRAQVGMLYYWNYGPPKAAVFTSDKAVQRYFAWYRSRSHGRDLDPHGSMLLGAEMEFAEFFMRDEVDTVREVERQVQEYHPGWSLAATADLPPWGPKIFGHRQKRPNRFFLSCAAPMKI